MQKLLITNLMQVCSSVFNNYIIKVFNGMLLIFCCYSMQQSVSLYLQIQEVAKYEKLANMIRPSATGVKNQQNISNMLKINGLNMYHNQSDYNLYHDDAYIIARYNIHLDGNYMNFVKYLYSINNLGMIKKIHYLRIWKEKQNIRINLDFDVLYENDY